MANRRKTSSKRSSVARRPQPQGGYLQTGNPGNAGGAGRPPAAIRAASRAGYDELMPVVLKIGKNARAKHSDRIRAADVLGKYGMGQPVSIDDVLECWHETVSVIRERFAPDISEPLIVTLRPIWIGIGQPKQRP